MANLGTDWCISSTHSHIEHLEAKFTGHAYEMHRHDTYALGITLSGVQSFHYRRCHLHSHPGMAMVLFPDELHDGHASDELGFHYHMIYIPPALIQRVLGGTTLPYIAGGISTNTRLVKAICALISLSGAPLSSFAEENGIADLAYALQEISDDKSPNARVTPDYAAAQRVREYIDNHLSCNITLGQLESIADQERWTLTRDFRALFGTSPYRYFMLRRLDFARQQIRAGEDLAFSAISSGFSDQAHMTRAFKKAFGVTPAKWKTLMQKQMS